MKKQGSKIVLFILAALLVAGGVGVYVFVIRPRQEQIPVKSAYSPGDFFVTNVRDSNALFKTSVVLEVNKSADDKKFQQFLADNNHIIRDVIVFTLRSKTEAELRSDDIRDTLARELVQALNSELGIDNIKAVYFNDYVIQ